MVVKSGCISLLRCFTTYSRALPNLNSLPGPVCLLRDRISLKPGNVRFSTSASLNANSEDDPPAHYLMDINNVLWPRLLNTAKVIFLVQYIKYKIDPQFSHEEFLDACKQVMCIVSRQLSQGKVSELKRFVVPEILGTLDTNLRKFNLKEQTQLKIEEEDIYFSFVYDVNLFGEHESDPLVDRRIIEFQLCFHAMTDLEKFRTQSAEFTTEDLEKNVFVANYHFRKNYNCDRVWKICALNHFKPKTV